MERGQWEVQRVLLPLPQVHCIVLPQSHVQVIFLRVRDFQGRGICRFPLFFSFLFFKDALLEKSQTSMGPPLSFAARAVILHGETWLSLANICTFLLLLAACGIELVCGRVGAGTTSAIVSSRAARHQKEGRSSSPRPLLIMRHCGLRCGHKLLASSIGTPHTKTKASHYVHELCPKAVAAVSLFQPRPLLRQFRASL